jgi:hypothetical protein
VEFEGYKKETVKHLRDSIRLFSSEGKKKRELWVAKKFLNVLGLSYTVSELLQPKDDPPDVTFRDARFEIMEVMEEGRKRHKEYKDKLKKVEIAQNYSEVLSTETWGQEMISLQELLGIVDDLLIQKKGDYSTDVKAKLDALMYVNLKKSYIEDEDYVFTLPQDSRLRQWRSASLVFNRNIVCVSFASSSAPPFILAASGKVIKN